MLLLRLATGNLHQYNPDLGLISQSNLMLCFEAFTSRSSMSLRRNLKKLLNSTPVSYALLSTMWPISFLPPIIITSLHHYLPPSFPPSIIPSLYHFLPPSFPLSFIPSLHYSLPSGPIPRSFPPSSIPPSIIPSIQHPLPLSFLPQSFPPSTIPSLPPAFPPSTIPSFQHGHLGLKPSSSKS